MMRRLRVTVVSPPSTESSPHRAGAKPEIAPDADPREWSEEHVDESLEETFPCSDPPSWACVLRVGRPGREPAD
jgi:hypothetical protein